MLVVLQARLRRTVQANTHKHAGTAYNSVMYARPRYLDAFDEHWQQQLTLLVSGSTIQDSSIHGCGTEHNRALQNSALYSNQVLLAGMQFNQ